MSVIKKNKEWLRTWHWVTKLTFYHNTVKGQPAESSLGLHDTVWKIEHERITGKLSKQKKNKKWIIWWWHCGCEFILRTCALRENLQSTGLMNIINHERALSDWTYRVSWCNVRIKLGQSLWAWGAFAKSLPLLERQSRDMSTRWSNSTPHTRKQRP